MADFLIVQVMALIMAIYLLGAVVVVFFAFAKPVLRDTMVAVVLWIFAATAYWMFK